MKFIFKLFIKIYVYCLLYVSITNLSASYLNNSINTLTISEIVSTEGMISGQRDIVTFIKFEIENVDIDKIRENVLREIDKIQN